MNKQKIFTAALFVAMLLVPFMLIGSIVAIYADKLLLSIWLLAIPCFIMFTIILILVFYVGNGKL